MDTYIVSNMSDCVARPSPDEDVISMISSEAHQPSWMSRCINSSSKSGSVVDNSSMVSYNRGLGDTRGCLMQSGLKMENSLLFGKGASNIVEEINTGGCVNGDLTKKPGNSRHKLSDLSFPSLALGQYKENVSTVRTEVDHEFDHKSMALALAVGTEDTSRDFNLRSSKQQVMSHLFRDPPKGIATSRSCRTRARARLILGPMLVEDEDTLNKSNASKPVVVFGRHFSNDDFTCFSQDHCKYKKSSSVLFREKNMENDLGHESGLSDGQHLQHGCPVGKKNFQSFLRQQSQNNLGHPLDTVPCSYRNVETMRIGTMVESVENSPGDPPKNSKRHHPILYTKETCVNLSKGHLVIIEPSLAHQENKTFGGPSSMFTIVTPHSRGVKIQPRGVKIQPLCTSTDDSEDKENTGDPSICNAGSRNEVSAETDGMQPPKNRHISLGMESSPITKDDTIDESNPPAASDSSTEKAGSKRPITEISDINEELHGLQPAVSATDGKDPCTSKVHSLNSKQLFSSYEQTSMPEGNTCQEKSFFPDSSNRWIKRLKVSSSDSFEVDTKSSDIREGSSHENFNMFSTTNFNRERLDAKLCKHHGKDQMTLDQNVESLTNGGSSSLDIKKRNQSMMLGYAWIQRWCQSFTAPSPSNPKPLVVCEPHSFKSRQDELAKKQFPSIAAMALMGKAMNGFCSCEFKKRGSIIVWNTKEY